MSTSAQQQIISALNVAPEIDPATEVQRRVEFLCQYLRQAGASGLVLGISGGVDSTVAGRLAQLAVEKLQQDGIEARFTAVRLPYRVQADESDATAAMEFIRPTRAVTFQIGPATDEFGETFRQATGEQISDFNFGNVKARMRMVAQYALAGIDGDLVVGTDHAAEAVTGFYTKFGDGAFDIGPLQGLNKRQVRGIARYLGAPEHLWAKVPTADLLDDQPQRTDEDELGLTYDQIDDFLEGKTVPEDVAERIISAYRASAHKRALPTGPVAS